jgi:HK97 family phage portal protein
MRIGPFTIARTKFLQLNALSGRGGWWPISVREPFTGAWQRNDEVRMDTVLGYSAVFACTTLIMGDLGKLCLRLVEQNDDEIWKETESAAFSPVLRKPNRYQNRSQFIETWTASKLNAGNTYVLKQRDSRRVVTAMYVLDPLRVRPLVTPDGGVYYELKRDDLSGLPDEVLVVPASEIFHDRMNCLFHPLVGLSPIFACSVSARQGLSIIGNSQKLFTNGAVPGGVLTAPGAIAPDTALRLKNYWDTNFTGDNAGKVAVVGDGLKFEPMGMKATDAQLVEQLKLTAEQVCSCYHVPPYLIDAGPPPPYANVEPVLQKYYSQCLQTLINSLEMCLDEGLGLGKSFGNRFGTEFDPDDLIWLDAAAKSKAALDGIGSGGMSPNEARKRFYGLGPVKGGESPYLQEQNYSLAALAQRDANDPFAKPAPTPPPTPAAVPPDEPPVKDLGQAARALLRKSLQMEAAA